MSPGSNLRQHRIARWIVEIVGDPVGEAVRLATERVGIHVAEGGGYLALGNSLSLSIPGGRAPTVVIVARGSRPES